jgi:site-specific DNA-methyltransferase (adenine-specific)
MSGLMRNVVLVGDAAEKMKALPPKSIDCVITSPPYYMLRDYGVNDQIGLEPNVELWVGEMRLVCRGLARVLKDTGSLWLNLGDSFSRHRKYGAPAKGLLAAPERLLLGLMDDDWICRGKVIWAKPNPMPSSVRDRLNMTYEVVYHLVRSPRYYFNLDLIREPHRSRGNKSAGQKISKPPSWAGPLAGKQDGLRRARLDGVPGHVLGKNPGDVWWMWSSLRHLPGVLGHSSFAGYLPRGHLHQMRPAVAAKGYPPANGPHQQRRASVSRRPPGPPLQVRLEHAPRNRGVDPLRLRSTGQARGGIGSVLR